MTLTDYDGVMALWRHSEGIALGESDSREGFAQFLARNPGLSLIARNESGIVGAVLCGHDGRRGYLHHLAVAVPQRRKGIGTALVRQCLEQLHALHIPKCNIYLLSGNEAGLRYWSDSGWAARDDLKVMQQRTSPAGGVSG